MNKNINKQKLEKNMNWINHALFPFLILYISFKSETSIFIIILFSIIFSIIPDFDFLTRYYIFKNKKPNLRTWLQEPFAIIAISIPLGIIFNYIFGHPYFYLVTIPYASHIFLDYISNHTVRPFSPFSSKEMKTGFIKPIKPPLKNLLDFKTFNENYLTILLLIIILLITL